MYQPCTRSTGREVIFAGEEPVNVGTSIGHLGFILDKGLMMSHHIRTACEKMRSAARESQCLLQDKYGPSFIRQRVVVQTYCDVCPVLWDFGLGGLRKGATQKGNLKMISKPLRL